MPTSPKGKDGPKRNTASRLQDRPFNDKDLVKPEELWPEVSDVWDETVEAMPDGYFKSGDQRPLQAYCVAVASWLVVLSDVMENTRIDGGETADSKLERSLRAEVLGTAKSLGILTQLEHRMKEERPQGALALLDAHRGKAS